tara:strand:+ start:17032 stop:18252 length:1221 start_codon:yes stop_codon:yes gene_type:complete
MLTYNFYKINKISFENIYQLENLEVNHLPIFSDLSIEFLSQLSKNLFELNNIRDYTDVAAFAFWCRKKNLEKLFSSYKNHKNKLGRGVAFHITPTNVPVNFAFSFAFGMLSGSSNIVRVPSKEFSQVEIISSEIFKLFKQKRFSKLTKMNLFITYKKDLEITELISRKANSRLIWGGDETIKSLKKLTSNPRCIDICFPDRYSLCIINANVFLKLTNEEKIEISKKFFNDTFILNQNACSSPHLIIWHGEHDICKKAKIIFWRELLNIIYIKGVIEKSEVMEKFRHLCATSMNLKSQFDVDWKDNMIYRIDLKEISSDIYKYKFRSGFFFEYSTKDLKEIWEIINEKHQTITYFGINPDFLYESILRMNILGIDRIVPIGQALQISHIWDGFDIINILSRTVDIHH